MNIEVEPAAAPRRAFQRVKTPRVFEGVSEQIKHKLKSGELKAGDRLPAERDLAMEFGVGRPAVREALRTLEISGIVETRKGTKGGAFVCEGSPEMLTRSLQDLAMLGHISPDSLAEVRVIISGAVVRLACERGEAEDFDAIETNIEDIQRWAEAGDLTRRAEAAVEFFRLLAKATRNDVLVVLMDSLGAILRHFAIERQPAKYRPELIPVRWNMLKHLRARATAKAVAEMNHYLEIVHSDALSRMSARPDPEAPKPRSAAPSKARSKA
jgi:DNA-binding FadR family transcriptional regulator